MKKVLIMLALAIGCDDAPDCGEYPTAPGWAVSFENVNGYERALLTVSDYQNIATWRDHVTQWAACMEGRDPSARRSP